MRLTAVGSVALDVPSFVLLLLFVPYSPCRVRVCRGVGGFAELLLQLHHGLLLRNRCASTAFLPLSLFVAPVLHFLLVGVGA